MARPPKGQVIWADRALRIVSRKTCPRCSRLLPPDRFGPDRRSATGLASLCNECIAYKNRQVITAMPDERRQALNAQKVENTRCLGLLVSSFPP